jgi:hypothetical protein
MKPTKTSSSSPCSGIHECLSIYPESMRIDGSLPHNVEPLLMRVTIILQPISCLIVANISSSVQRFDSPSNASTISTSGSVAGSSPPQCCHCHPAPPTSFLGFRHCIQMTIPKTNGQKKRKRRWAMMKIKHNT